MTTTDTTTADTTGADLTVDPTASGAQTRTPPRLKQRYRSEILPSLHEQFGYGNRERVPAPQAAVPRRDRARPA